MSPGYTFMPKAFSEGHVNSWLGPSPYNNNNKTQVVNWKSKHPKLVNRPTLNVFMYCCTSLNSLIGLQYMNNCMLMSLRCNVMMCSVNINVRYRCEMKQYQLDIRYDGVVSYFCRIMFTYSSICASITCVSVFICDMRIYCVIVFRFLKLCYDFLII